uniref:Ovule protein n=2 Tax=Bursaphelenchus xylophilus TaxID=6326 RepID=A0A1I7SJS5_BURXY
MLKRIKGFDEKYNQSHAELCPQNSKKKPFYCQLQVKNEVFWNHNLDQSLLAVCSPCSHDDGHVVNKMIKAPSTQFFLPSHGHVEFKIRRK